MDDNVSDEDLKEEIMRCFSNAPTTIQAIGVLRGIDKDRMNKLIYMQLDMNLFTTGQTTSCQRSKPR